MHAPGVWGIVVIGAVIVLLFGRGKISGLMGELASGIKAFRGGLKDYDIVESTAAAAMPNNAAEEAKTS